MSPLGATVIAVSDSNGGLHAPAGLDIGAIIELRIPTVDPPFEAHAKVVWCRPEYPKFLVGVEFLDKADAFRSRMVEQICTIEGYRQQVLREEGRDLSALKRRLRRATGAIPSDEALDWALRDRAATRRQILARLAEDGLLPSPDEPADPAELRGAVHAFLRRTPADPGDINDSADQTWFEYTNAPH